MPDLERDLRELGASIDYPPTPDVAEAVRRRIVEPKRRRPWRRPAFVIALAVLAIGVGAVMAVPQARSALLEWLGLRGVEIERVPTQPAAPAVGADLDLGERVTLAEARRLARYRVLVPAEEADGVYFSPLLPGGQVSFVYGTNGRTRLLVSEFRAGVEEQFIRKAAGPGTRVDRVRVNGGRGFWLEGAPHEFVFLDPQGNPSLETLRLARNTLLWEQGGLTLRIEGDVTKEEALRVARGMR